MKSITVKLSPEELQLLVDSVSHSVRARQSVQPEYAAELKHLLDDLLLLGRKAGVIAHERTRNNSWWIVNYVTSDNRKGAFRVEAVSEQDARAAAKGLGRITSIRKDVTGRFGYKKNPTPGLGGNAATWEDEKEILQFAINAAEKLNIIKQIKFFDYARAMRTFRKNLQNPGELRGDTVALAGLSVAETVIGKGPGYIPEVQRIGIQIAEQVEKDT